MSTLDYAPIYQTAQEHHDAGATPAVIAAHVAATLEQYGLFGKTLDAKTRRVVERVTGTRLEPGQGSGTIRPDGSVSYRR